MKYLLFAMLLGLAAITTGCAPYIGSCSWVVPEGGADLVTVAPREPTAGDCDCVNCKAPGRFLLEREKYTLEFWNGDRWYAELSIMARSADGEVLFLSSDSPELVRSAPHVPEYVTHGFEYFVRMENDADPPKVMTLRIVDPRGNVLGVETIRLRVERRKDLAVETI